MSYLCKTCRSYQHWEQCPKCGEVFCQKCALRGEGGYPKMGAINRCPFCNRTITFGLTKLKGNEDFLKPLSR